ncbi:MAG: bifunctional diaminohydroxyphosphoribosylaminopyrimidine deaminase/5-amino-6-(5-phosphoribosylamino)uracil reductase RibD [Gammaproteobacteria bacterium]|nr:bifunctional diaminohydroxyphosphoribosylaminopyrimidine deaminase/5-amino-6-(5-phosphoribosylamino)uracil reductase RibD [Gammaproteobacteria bacterium]
MIDDTDIIHLHQALELAKIRRGFCAPNPSVGALIFKDNAILAAGFHHGPGSDHAEVDALRKLTKAQSIGATAYITLEPCCHHGRTPPCTDALIEAGLKRVVYAYPDPNPLVSGKGEKALLAAGILCEHISLPEINLFYESYHHWHATQTPFVTAKIAISLDGKIASKTGEPIAITGEALKEFTHYSRRSSDALLTTAKTIIQDDPQLNVRTPDETLSKALYVLDSALTLPLNAKIFETAKSITIFHAKDASSENQQKLVAQGARCLPLPHSDEGLSLVEAIKIIGQDGIHSLWIEAGGKCFSAFVKQRLLQRAYLYVAPTWLGEGKIAFSPEFHLNIDNAELQWQQFGKDVLCEIRW